MNSLVSQLLAEFGPDLGEFAEGSGDIYTELDDDDDMLSSDTPDNGVEQSAFDRQSASLQTYINSVPYNCENVEQMQEKLEFIVGRVIVCAKAKNWLVLTSWDGMLQCWLLMHYPMATTTRAKLVRLYYELCLLPGIEPRVIRSWADMLSRLLSNKPGLRRKLEATDLQLSWQPLWRVLQKELWPKKRVQDSSRNLVNILLYVAEQCRRYYPASEIPNMLSTFLPLLTKESILTMIPVITSFVPPVRMHLYMPALFKLWEAFNSSIMDDRLLEYAGELSEEHIGSRSSDLDGDCAEWKDIGIWTETEWMLLVGKGLGSLNVPVGAAGGTSTTAGHADKMDNREPSKIKKSVSRLLAISRILVYSISTDGPVRGDSSSTPLKSDGKFQAPQNGYIAGSKALDSLDKIITSTESFFHPSNSGGWTPLLTNFLQRLTSEFNKRVKEEEESTCTTPESRRLTPAIRRSFVKILRIPALLAMFSKDPVSMSFAQGALRNMALLEPNLIMPELLERAYGGMEVVNETHRTTAVLSMLSGIARPLVCESVWLGGQKHVVPLLELCIPGIDLNDHIKTVCATMFIVSVVQHIKIGDISTQQSGLNLSNDVPGESMDTDAVALPDGIDVGETPVLSREEERALVRDSTASFADWVTSLFRRVFAVYENLPEEGGKRNTTGGKQEESVLKAIKSMLDVVCLHLSDDLFNLVLNLVFNYATTNAKSNAVRAFGQLLASLARVRPEQTIAKFLPFCMSQIEDELKHGASNVRTTSSHNAAPSDTTLHWNMAILRGCLGYGGAALLKHKERILVLLSLLVEKTKSERGYTGTGRLLTRVLHTLAGVYPLSSRFVNVEEWESSEFDRDHILYWGRLYKPQDAQFDWHVPSPEEIDFVLEILDKIAEPALNKVEELMQSTVNWDIVARNDFCRALHAIRSMWSGLPALYQEQEKKVVNPCLSEDIDVEGLIASDLDVKAGFTLTEPKDPRYQRVVTHRSRFGNVIQRAAVALRRTTEGEDHIDAVIEVTKAIDVYLLDYGSNRSEFDSLQKNYHQARDLNRIWSKQKENSRLVFVKRAYVYHVGRLYMHALYRRRSELDDQLLMELAEFSLSPYTRVRRHAQVILQNVCGYYVRSTKFVLPVMLDALSKGNDPDRMKGALYVLWNKGIAAYALSDPKLSCSYLLALLQCQHEEKPSIQKLVNNIAHDCVSHLNEESVHTDAYPLETPRLNQALMKLKTEFSPSFVSQELLAESLVKRPARISNRKIFYDQTISLVLETVLKPNTHWRYVQMAVKFLYSLLRRDAPASPSLAKFFMEHTLSPQPAIRLTAQSAVVKLTSFAKIRTYSKSGEELWLDEWNNPAAKHLTIKDSSMFLKALETPIHGNQHAFYVDKIRTGFLTWTPTAKAYSAVHTPLAWETDSARELAAICEVMRSADYFKKLSLLWSQESNKSSGTTEMRSKNVSFVKSLAKMFQKEPFADLLEVIDPLLLDQDRFKQRAGAEFLTGLLRGSKHWSKDSTDKLWSWTTQRLQRILAQVKPDTLAFWESVLSYQLLDRDPRRNQALVDWIFSLSLDSNSDSAFEMTKSLLFIGILADSLKIRFNPFADKYVNTMFDNANTGYAEVRGHIAQNLYMILRNQWQPSYSSTSEFLRACREVKDPLHIREAKHAPRLDSIMKQMPAWKEERFPPPRVNQSEYDKVGLALLHWIWVSAHGAQAFFVFSYAVPMMPEILRMSELNDSSELQAYSSAVLYVLSAVTPLPDYIEIILDNFVNAIKSSTSWRIRLHALPALVVFFYRNLLSISPSGVSKVMDVLLDCLADDNVEVREMASKVLSGVVRCSQRQSILPLKNRFMKLAQSTKLPRRQDPGYSAALRSLHSAILGLCTLIDSFPYSVESWMPSLTEVLAPHATDPPPISTTIRQCASQFKKTHQDTWHKDQLMFDEEQLQSLSTMLVGTSYYA